MAHMPIRVCVINLRPILMSIARNEGEIRAHAHMRLSWDGEEEEDKGKAETDVSPEIKARIAQLSLRQT